MAVEALALVKARHTAVTAWAACCKFGGHGDRHVLIAHCRATRRYLEAAYPAETWGILAVSKTSGHAADEEMWQGTNVIDGGWINAYVCIPNPAWHDVVAAVRHVADIVFDVQYVVGTYVQDERFLPTLHEGAQRMAPFASYYSGFPTTNNELARRFTIDQWALMSRSCPVTVTPADMHAPCDLPAITLKAPPSQARSREFVQRMAGCVVIHAGQGGSHARKLPHPDVWRAVAAAAWEHGAIPVQVGLPSEPSVLGAVDARGLSIAETGYLVKHARLVVAAEGFMAYVARAVGTRALVWFGPTSPTLFAFGRELDADGSEVFPGHISWSADRCEACWWHCDGWDKRPCPKGHPYCVNLPSASDAHAATSWAIAGMAAEPVPASAASVVDCTGGTTEPAPPAEREENGAMDEQERSGEGRLFSLVELQAAIDLRREEAQKAGEDFLVPSAATAMAWAQADADAWERANTERPEQDEQDDIPIEDMPPVEPLTPEQDKALDELPSEDEQLHKACLRGEHGPQARLDALGKEIRAALAGGESVGGWVAKAEEVAEQQRKLDALAEGAEVAVETCEAGGDQAPLRPSDERIDIMATLAEARDMLDAEKVAKAEHDAEVGKVAEDAFGHTSGARQPMAAAAAGVDGTLEPAPPAEPGSRLRVSADGVPSLPEPWEAPDDGAQVHLVMTTYTRRELLLSTLESLGNQTRRPATLWLLDDGWLETGQPLPSAILGCLHRSSAITLGGLICGGSRVGQAGQLNRGFALARDAVRQSGWLNRTYMVKLEDDLEFTEGWLRRLIYVWEHPIAACLNLGMIGGAYGQPGQQVGVGRETVKLTHHVGAWCMFAPLTMWEDYLPIPPRPRADKQGGKPPTASSADWYINRTGRRSVLAQGRQCACLGVVKHIGTAEGVSTWKR